MKKTLLTTIVFLLLITLISIFGIDIKFSSLFFEPTTKRWLYSEYPMWRWFYEHGSFIPLLIGLSSLVVFIISLIKQKYNYLRNRAAIALIVIILAPGIIVQTLKVTWGRPRPIETTIFGGQYEFRTPFEPNFKMAGDKNNGNSFPSGHAAIGFYTIILYFIFRKKWILPVTLVYGSLMATARIAQGGHFLSDVVSSFFIVYICIELFEFLLIKKQK